MLALREQIAIKDGCGENFIEVFGTKHKHGFMLHNRSIFSRCGRTEREQGRSLDSSAFFRFDSDPGKEIRRHQDKCHAARFRDGTNTKMSGITAI